MDFRFKYTRENESSYLDGYMFSKRGIQDSQNLNNDTFYRPPLASAQSNIGTDKYPDAGTLLNYDNDDCSQRYGQIKKNSQSSNKR